MSFRSSRRRRRGGRRSASLAGDPLDLFLDAITNALGVVKFILLRVVLFGRAGDTPSETPQPDAQEMRSLEEQRKELRAQLEALPPAGDPDLAARWKAAMERVQRLEREEAELRLTSSSAEARTEDASARLAEDREAEQRLVAEAEKAAERARASSSGFIRVSRFRADSRSPVLLALNGGRLSRVRITADTKEIPPPAGGASVTDLASAREAVRKSLDGSPAATHRVELMVWEGSFAQAKLVEQALLDAGYDWNPLPVRAGTAVPQGTGGVQ
jgi:hypothetical protein